MASSGAKVEDVKLMKEIVGDNVKVKAAGGVKNLNAFLDMIENGAERIGTSSGIKIITELKDKFEKEELTYLEI